MLAAVISQFDRAGRVAAFPAGESPANRGSPVTVVVISSGGKCCSRLLGRADASQSRGIPAPTAPEPTLCLPAAYAGSPLAQVRWQAS
jgi:hypothetical protein